MDRVGPFQSKKRGIIGYFTAKEGPEYDNVARIASNLREECQFWLGFGFALSPFLMVGDWLVFVTVS